MANARKQAWQFAGFLSSLPPVIGFLRFIGLVNASIWFGSVFFFTLVAGPAFFSHDMKVLLGNGYVVYADPLWLIILGKFYFVQKVCGVVALIHLLAEWLYTGKGQHKFMVYALVALFGLAMLGSYLVQPTMVKDHYAQYQRGYPPAEIKRVQDAYAILRGFVHLTNVLATAALLVYLWRIGNPPDTPRFSSKSKFRG